MQVKIQAEPSFIPNMLDQHERELADIKQYWDKKFVTTKEELKDFMRKVYDYMYAFDFMYYSGVDERTPADLRTRALKIRDVDSYFGTSDDMIRLSLQKIYPELKGLESTILFNEIDNPPAKEILQARKRASIMNGSELFVGSLSEYRALHNDYVFEIETPPTDATTLVGQAGNKGYAKGVVRILKRKEQIDEAQEGDIIVSAMTTPEFVPAMKKAAAIITDEGGITCHAAIVARELNKPCVIGTKFATALLKDGDIVEVDADNGIVRIISTNDLLRDLRILNKDLWIEDGRWVQSPLIWSLFTHWSDASVVKRITENCDLGGIFTIDGYAFHDIKTFNNLNAYLEKLYKGEKLKDLALRTDAEGSKLFKEIITTLQKDDDYILTNFESLFKNYQEFIGFWTATTVIGNQISPLAKKMGVVSTEADLFEKVHPYLRESWIEEEVAAMRRIAEQYVEKYPDHSVTELVSRIDSDTELKDTIAVYLKKFSWARISKWAGDPIDIEYAQKRLAEEINNVVEKNYIDRMYKNNIDECDGLVAVSVNAAYYRAQATMLEMMMAERMHSIFTTIGKVNGLEFSDVLLLTPQELQKLVKNPDENIANKDEVMERKNPFFCVVDTHGVETILTAKDKEYSIVYDLYIDTHKNDQTTELRGIGASKGKVTAKVRIINSAKEFENFKEGEILVAVETSPTFVPLMRMAAAILTGRGGITSHAAIVSRELNKPCIIAIKDITKILNDGDEVEVDADNGIVKILTKSTSLVDQLKDIDWDVQRFNAYPFFISSVATLSGFKLPWNLSYKHFLCISHSKNVEWHYDKNDYQQLGEIFWNKVQNLDDIQKLITEYRNTYQEAVLGAVYKEADLDQLSVDELKDLLKKQVDRLWASGGIAHIVECASYVAEQKLKQEYKIDPQTIKPSEMSFLRKAELYAQELFDSGKSEQEILQAFEKEYAWIQSSYLGRNTISIDFIKELAQKNKTEHIETIENGGRHDFTEILSHLFSWQDERKANILSSIYYSQPVLDALARKLNISEESIKFLLPEEVEKTTDPSFQNELVERAKLFVDYAPKTLQRTILTGSQAQEFIDQFSEVIDEDVTILHGQAAFAGKVTGVIRVCLSLEAIDNFKDGEILVASMTRPEYVPAMKKASAFITDEGGITCHAAIIARELKKPCVIGTKRATKILKDGDVVEVDADNGTVTIIGK